MSLNTSKTISKIMYNNVEIPLSGSENICTLTITCEDPITYIYFYDIETSSFVNHYLLSKGTNTLKTSVNSIFFIYSVYTIIYTLTNTINVKNIGTTIFGNNMGEGTYYAQAYMVTALIASATQPTD